MSCDKQTKKRILFFSIIGGGIGITAILLLSNANNNNNLAIILPFLASFAICPAMCAMIGGGFWITSRLFGTKRQASQQTSKENISDLKEKNTIK
ncbi:MAG: hypothetical protein ACRD8K_11510 [Nitrososphaeraceae archaeon]